MRTLSGENRDRLGERVFDKTKMKRRRTGTQNLDNLLTKWSGKHEMAGEKTKIGAAVRVLKKSVSK